MNYKKLRRRYSINAPVLILAIALRLEKNRVCSEARIVIVSVDSSRLGVFEAEKN